MRAVARIALGLLFLISGASKLRYPRIFAQALAGYALLPDSAVTLVAVTLPWLELLPAVCLLAGRAVRAGLLIIGGLSGLFFLALSSVLWRGLDISCGCVLGGEGSAVSGLHPVFNLLVLAVCVWLYIPEVSKSTPM